MNKLPIYESDFSQSVTVSHESFDLIIVGGGIVGLIFAMALRNTPLKIALVEAMPLMTSSSESDQRLFALSHASCKFLKTIDLWSQLIEDATPIHQVHVSQAGYFGAMRLSREHVAVQALGHVIPANTIQRALNHCLAHASNLIVYQPATLEKISVHANAELRLVVKTSLGIQGLKTRLLIAADGADSTVRKQLNVPACVIDYQQRAIVTRTRLAHFHQHIAYERFNVDGALAMLPLGKEHCATIWSANRKTIHHLEVLSDDEFLNALQHMMGDRLGPLQSITKRTTFDLRNVRLANNHANPPVLFIGNAAQTLHPIAAQGLNIALLEVAALTAFIQAKCIRGQAQAIRFVDLQAVSLRVKKQQCFGAQVSHYLGRYVHERSLIKTMLFQSILLGMDKSVFLKKSLIERFLGKKKIMI